MSVKGSARALRSVVADLARLDDEDLQAILDELDGAARQRLTGLLHDFQHGDGAPPTLPLIGPPITLGEWLSDRLSGRDSIASLAMTPTARQALRRAAQAHGWTETPAPHPSAGLRQALATRMGFGR